ncbi:MAG TPA: tripartite tricarboxylate transporter TctB family protein [Burkholderiales bacterium]|jgi:Na+/melibiose symporter-like transporter|nr:tripartite tricarboxylate transporter TctB family protein [Burkholderiales bacterium]
MLSRSGIAGLVCLAISIWLLFLTRGLPPPIMVPIGPAFYPRVVLSFMALCSALLVVMDLVAFRRRRAVASTEQSATARKPAAARPNYSLVIATFVEFFVYILLLPGLGFRIATTVFVFALQITLEQPRSWKRWLLTVLVAIGTTVVCYIAFERYLLILLPRGDWTGM